MEHIIQFAVGIDDNAIRERVEANAEKEIIEDIKNDVKAHLYKENDWGRGYSKQPSTYFDNKVTSFMNEHKDEIISLAADRLAERLSKTKAAKELIK